jgi:hypothetical protein
MAAVESHSAIKGPTLAARVLDREGRVQLAPGVTVHRPCPDSTRAEPEADPTGFLTRVELDAIKAAFAPLAANETAQRETYEQAGEVRYSTTPEAKAQLAQLEAKTEALKAEHAPLRGAARLAYLNALESASIRAGAAYRRACAVVADEAAELEALARLRDDLLRTASFDPLGIWQRASALLAPPHHLRPPGWATVSDVWQRDLYWNAESPGHLDAVRRAQQKFRAELEPAQGGAAFPF